MILIVGLGNPGKEYKHTRHNAGNVILEYIATHYNTQFSSVAKIKSDLAKLRLTSNIILLAKPLTYMNCSGVAVSALKAFYKLPNDGIVVIHDDIDLAIGDIRFKIGGGDAGHNGLKSISAAIGSDYLRIRVGVGRPMTNSNISVASYVLSEFSDDELAILHNIGHRISENCKLVYDKQFEQLIAKIKQY